MDIVTPTEQHFVPDRFTPLNLQFLPHIQYCIFSLNPLGDKNHETDFFISDD